MKAPVTIHSANLDSPRDTADLLELLDEYARDPMGGGAALPEDVRARVVDDLRGHPTTRVFLARSGERALGLAICFAGYSTFAGRPLLNIHDLAVRADARGRGVGTKLIAAVADAVRKLGGCKVTLEVRDHNVRAKRVYASAGFESPGGGTRFLELPVAR